MKIIVLLFLCFSRQVSAGDIIFINSFEPSLNLISEIPPFTLNNPNATFYQDVAYGEYTRNVFDIFLPPHQGMSSLVIYIHGGGFTSGDKSSRYTSKGFQSLINQMLSVNIAFATINYRLLEDNDLDGVLKSLNDSKRALQFMKYHANVLNLNKDKVLLMGSSAGAGTSLWLAFSDDMALGNSTDGVLNESSRVQGLICLSTQSSYDLLEWHNSTFFEYQNQGFDFETVRNLLTEDVLYQFYGISNDTELFSVAIQQDRLKLDMLALLSNDDPEFYLSNSNHAYVFPITSGELLHHPLHSKALMDKAMMVNVPSVIYLPTLGIDTRNGESIFEFIYRKIGN